jgi:hypothetical protein
VTPLSRRAFGHSALNWRSTLSSGQTAVGRPSSHTPLQLRYPHQASACAMGRRYPLPGQPLPDLAHATNADVRLVHAPDFRRAADRGPYRDRWRPTASGVGRPPPAPERPLAPELAASTSPQTSSWSSLRPSGILSFQEIRCGLRRRGHSCWRRPSTAWCQDCSCPQEPSTSPQ